MIDDETPTPRPWVPDPPMDRTGPGSGAPPPPSASSSGDEHATGRNWARVAPGWAFKSAGADPPSGWQPVAGPVDRVSFFEEQARHRRATWRLAAASTLAVVLAGIPLSLVVTPIVFLVLILLTKAVSLVVPVSPAVPQLYRSVALAIGSIVEAMDRWPPPPALLGSAMAGALALVVPGILTMLACWMLLRRMFSGAGVGALTIALGARPPRLNDLEERQLVNVVEEMAIAAGLPTPQVMLFDGQIANAAAVGSSPADATVIVSRRLLDEMDRDETQGVLGHVIASIGNGDLGIALMMITVFRAFGLVTILLDAPISTSARATLWQFLSVTLGPRRRDDDARVAQVAELLGERAEEMEIEDVDLVLGGDAQKAKAPRGLRGLLLKIRVYALFPIWAASGMARTAMNLLIFALLSPLLGWTWRERCFLADATAVQLTRNPDGIARGLQALLTRGGGIRGGEWANHLFVVGGGGGSGSSTFGWVSPHPSLQKRLKRLQAQGAHVDTSTFKRGPTPAQIGLMVLIFGPLIALCTVLLGVAAVLATGLTIVFMMIPLAIVYGIFELLF